MSKKITLEGLDHFKDKENAMIAGKPESTNTATVAHAVGEYFYWKGVLNIVTAAIAVGGTIQTNTNVKPAVLADDVSDLKESTNDLKTALTFIDKYDIAYIDELRDKGTVTIAPVYVNRTVIGSTGELGSASNIRASTENLIYRPDGATLRIGQTNVLSALVVHSFDISKNYLGSSNTSNIPQTAKYIRIVASKPQNAEISTAEAESNITITLTMQTADDKVNSAMQVINDKLTNEYVSKYRGKNLLNPNNSDVGYLLATDTLNTNATQYRTSELIPISSGDSVIITPRVRVFAFYNSSKTMIANSYMNTETQNYVATATANGYFRFTYYVADIFIQCKTGSNVTPYTPYQKIIDQSISLHDFESLKIATFGDSIMHGAGNPSTQADDGFIGLGDILALRYGFEILDHCVSGACVEYIEGREAKPVYQQILDAISSNITPNLIIMDGLSNDITIGTLGTLGNDFDYSTHGYNDFTYALEYCFGTLKNNFPNVPILYVIPHSSVGRTYATELQFGDRAREICKKWSIPIADVYKDGNLNSHITAQLEAFTNYPTESTGTHPNASGYDFAYLPLVVDWIKNVYAEIN